MSPRVLLTVSGTVPADLAKQIADGNRPRADYAELARVLDADIVDHAAAVKAAGVVGRLVGHVAGRNVLLAWECFRRRHRYDVVFTDGEQVGLPFAALLWLARRRPRHVMIVHILSVPKKVAVFRSLRLGHRIDAMFVYASAQARFCAERLRYPANRIVLTPFMVDTAFFAPVERDGTDPPLAASAGLEYRDYPTLVEAVRGLDVRVVIAAASPWSKRRDTSADVDLPPNVEIRRLGFADLRTLYAESDLVVVPIVETDFQAGITTILEAMAMGKPVICTRTSGQTDTIVDGESGVYVPAGSPHALREAIVRLLDDPSERDRLGAAARRWVVEHGDIGVYCERLARHVRVVPSETG